MASSHSNSLNEDQRYTVSSRVVWRKRVQGELSIFDLETSVSYGVNGLVAELFELFVQPMDFTTAVKCIARSKAQPQNKIRPIIRQALKQLLQANLIEVVQPLRNQLQDSFATSLER